MKKAQKLKIKAQMLMRKLSLLTFVPFALTLMAFLLTFMPFSLTFVAFLLTFVPYFLNLSLKIKKTSLNYFQS